MPNNSAPWCLALVLPATVFLLQPVAARASDACPWMNAATARGVLGGKATTSVTFTNTDKDEGRCVFELHRGEVAFRLTIAVSSMQMPARDFPAFMARCGSEATHLKAIGNEAVACGGVSAAERWELVVGRVRENAFVVRLSMSSNEPAAQSGDFREKARKAAELVASGLF